MASRTIRMLIDVPVNDHKRIKALATVAGITIKEFITECIHERIFPENIPNRITKKAIEDIRKKRNLKKAKNVNELFKELGI
ncbi:MAG TPA: hypothetical protein ENH96_06430 [Chlamydiae bacterium]|nr:hypothetical protein [Candidatus Anoxychlamydiales bacterium]HEU65001.1 hypothetical protein [Chlamydiota bacterium]